jgi:hypothetical protein
MAEFISGTRALFSCAVVLISDASICYDPLVSR